METLTYNTKLKKVSYSDLTFTPISTESIPDIFYDKQLTPEPKKSGFKKILLDLFSEAAGVEVLKYMVLFTPKQPKYDGYGFLYLKDKTILPIQIQPSENYQKWHKVITKGSDFLKADVVDWLVNYSDGNDQTQGMSHEWEGKFHTIEDYDIYQETGVFLHEHAPKKFNEKKIASEKRAYLKKYIASISGESLDNQLYSSALEPFKSKLNTPSLDLGTFIHSFLEVTKLDLPAELQALYQICDGSASDIAKGYEILSTERLLKDWKGWKEIFDEWLLEELKSVNDDQGKTLPMYITPYWIPFMTDSNGNYIALDFAPGKKGIAGQVIVFGADEHLIKVMAENLLEFLVALQLPENALTKHLDE